MHQQFSKAAIANNSNTMSKIQMLISFIFILIGHLGIAGLFIFVSILKLIC